METRTIRNAAPEKIESAIQPLIKEFLNAPYIWLPERRAELIDLNNQHQFRIVIDGTDHCFRFGAIPEKGIITVGLTAIERVWGYCFGLEKLYNFLRIQDHGKEIDTTQFPELLPARLVLNAVYQSEKNKMPIAWTPELPCPRSTPDDEDVLKANDRFISVMSFLLLHEIAHIVRKHSTKTYVSDEDKRAQEFEADLWAMKFTMDRLIEHNPSDDHFIARANGIVLGLCILSSVELVHPPSGIRHHPAIPERLLRYFNIYIPDHDGKEAHIREQPKFFVATILDAFLLNQQIDIDYAKCHANLFDPIIDVRQHFPG